MPTGYLRTSTDAAHNLFTQDDLEAQRAFFAARPELAPTPLRRCDALAASLGVNTLYVKDETARFGLNAFKAAGAVFAVSTLVARGEVRRGDTLACASEGNHGRAVARAARDAGCHARVYMSNAAAPVRVEAIEAEGATVVLVDGTYDAAVHTMAAEAERQGWVIISDTSWPGYTEIPRLIMLGYTRIMDEIDVVPDLVFVPAGVGGLLAAVACWTELQYPSGPKPRVVAVEPVSAACVQASVRAGVPTALPGPFPTSMAGLRCGEMSPAVFPAVATYVDAFIGIEDDYAFDAMRRLARPAAPDPVIECGPSGAAALGGVLALLQDPGLRGLAAPLGLDSTARIVVIATEGVTDPALFQRVLARP
jgi:diaminopropionate ammonia-lyase